MLIALKYIPRAGPIYVYRVGYTPGLGPVVCFGMWYFWELTELYSYILGLCFHVLPIRKGRAQCDGTTSSHIDFRIQNNYTLMF